MTDKQLEKAKAALKEFQNSRISFNNSKGGGAIMNPKCTCGAVLGDDDIATVHLHLARQHNMTIGEAVEQVSEYITFQEAAT